MLPRLPAHVESAAAGGTGGQLLPGHAAHLEPTAPCIGAAASLSLLPGVAAILGTRAAGAQGGIAADVVPRAARGSTERKVAADVGPQTAHSGAKRRVAADVGAPAGCAEP